MRLLGAATRIRVPLSDAWLCVYVCAFVCDRVYVKHGAP